MPGPVALRRLTADEYRNSVQAVLRLASPADGTLAPDPIGKNGFDNFGSSLNVDGTLASQYAAIASTLTRSLSIPACGSAETPTACAAAFVTDFGKGAFRRPLAPAESDQYAKLFADALALTNYERAIRQVAETMLQSPKFLYRFELGEASAGPTRTLTPYEVASELSYLFTSAPPDDALLAAALANALQSPAQIATEAGRLQKLPQAATTFRRLFKIYGGLLRLPELAKDATVYPVFTPELRSAMAEETDRFVDSVLAGPADFTTLMTAPYSYVNTSLAALYGVPDPGSQRFAQQALDPKQRSGLLTQASVLASHSKPGESFPIARGKFVRVGLLCQALPPPPAVVPKAPSADPTLTTRERFAAHSADPGCAGCHTLIDPVGFGLENYDGIGQYRATENGKPVDASGNITATLDMDGPYSGAVELAQKLAASAEAKACFSSKAFQWALGRDASAAEDSELQTVSSSLAPAGLNIHELMLAITQLDAFRFRTFE